MTLFEILEADLVVREEGRIVINDLELHSESEGVDVYIFWYTPGDSACFYPIVQINDDEGNLILNKTCYEGGDWLSWLTEKLQDYLGSEDWFHIR